MINEKLSGSPKQKNIFTDGIEKLKSEEAEERNTSFSFGSNKRRYFLGNNQKEYFFSIEIYHRLLDELSEEEKAKFTKVRKVVDGEEIDVYVMKVGPVPELKLDSTERAAPEYIIAPRRNFKERQQPKEMTAAELAEFIKDKCVLFYTGAGISMAHGVPGLAELETALGIDMDKRTDGFLKRSVTDSAIVIDSWKEFERASKETPATPAHLALAEIAKKKKSVIFTENVDELHAKTEVDAIHIHGSFLRENIDPVWLKSVDCVVTVGLSFDDRGFLGWYKENNPSGIIAAVNISQPPYLGAGDILVKGDAQTVVPEVSKKI